jgi:hypothetical protein
MGTVSDLATTIVSTEFSEDESHLVDASKVTAWLTANIGILATKISLDVRVEDDEFNPELNPDELSIFTKIFLCHFYEKAARNVLRAPQWFASSVNTGESVKSSWTHIKEGDNEVRRTSPLDVSRMYKSFAEQYSKELDRLIYEYQVNKSGPHAVHGTC